MVTQYRPGDAAREGWMFSFRDGTSDCEFSFILVPLTNALTTKMNALYTSTFFYTESDIGILQINVRPFEFLTDGS